MTIPHVLKRMLVSILALTVAAAVFFPSAAAAARSGESSRSSAAAGEPKCDAPDAQSLRVSSELGTSGTLGVGAEAEDGIISFILKNLGSTAVSIAGKEAIGWLLPMITGKQLELDPAEVNQQFRTINSKLDSLAQQQHDDCEVLLTALTHATDKAAYTNLAAAMDDQIGLLESYGQEFDNIATALQRNGGDVDQLNSDLKGDMRAMLSGGSDGLRNIINTINVKQAGNSPGAQAMVSFYTKILTEEFPYDPYQTHIFTPAFLNQGAAQQDYYASLITKAVYLYSNVAHLNFTDGDYKHENDPDSVVQIVNIAQKDIQHWSTLFADGPDNGTWVSQGVGNGIGTIPDGTVLDYRHPKDPRLWTTAPVGVNGEPSEPAPYYCPSTAQFCYADQYNGAGQVGDTRLVRPSPEPLPDLIGREQIGGVGGWRVPTRDDWQSLEDGATGGLSAWAPAHQLGNIFATQKVVSHYGGKDQTLTTIAPMLVNVGDGANPSYSVYSSTDPGANALTLEKPDITDPAQSDVAGRLFLDQNYQPTTPPKPFSTTPTVETKTSTPGQQTETGTSARRTKTHTRTRRTKTRTRTSKPRGATKTRGGHPSVQAVQPADLPGPTTFSTPVACASASSYKVPAGAGSVKITATGAAGADGLQDNKPSAPGGVGGVVTETVPVTAGETLYVQVGGVGAGHDDRRGGVGGGGNGGLSKTPPADAGDYAGGGGGASGVATTRNCSHWVIVAGGGGGGGAGYRQDSKDIVPRGDWSGGRGGDGCGTVPGCAGAGDGTGWSSNIAGKAGADAPDNHGGAVGLSGGPDASAGAPGSANQGGNGGASVQCCSGVGGGGGGGGGYYGGGGGGGAGNRAAGGGGAGGASFAIPGATDVSYGLGNHGGTGSVTITPIAKRPVPISVTASPDRLDWDQPLPVTLTAKLPADATGTVTFHDNEGGAWGPAPIRNGVATLAELAYSPRVGTVQVSASFAGDAHYAANDSTPVDLTVSKTTPFMNLTISGTVLRTGQQPTSLVVQMPTGTTGSVGFYDDIDGGCDGKTGVGAICQGLGVAPIKNGYATLTQLTAPLVDGENSIHASYGGDSEYRQDSHFNPNDSNSVTVTVGK